MAAFLLCFFFSKFHLEYRHCYIHKTDQQKVDIPPDACCYPGCSNALREVDFSQRREERGIDSLLDEYYSKKNGKYLGSDGVPNNAMRLIDDDIFNEIKSMSSGMPSSLSAVRLKAASSPVIIDSAQIQSDLQRVRDLSMSGFENQMIMVLDLKKGLVSSFMGDQGTNNTSSFYYFDAPGIGASMPVTSNGKRMTFHIIIGVAHGHPDPNLPGMITESRISPGNDLATAVALQIPIYGVDAMSRTGGLGTPGNIHRANPDGTIHNNIGKTRGSGPASFDIGSDALEVWGKSGGPK